MSAKGTSREVGPVDGYYAGYPWVGRLPEAALEGGLGGKLETAVLAGFASS